SRFIILTIGRMVEKKGHRFALEALSILKKRGKDIQYWIIGDGPLKANLENLVSNLGLEEEVSFLGKMNQNELLEIICRAHVLVLPSITTEQGDMEGIPLVLMEAMATGLPVISTEHSGIPELVVNGRTGLLVPEKDVVSLAEKIEILIDDPREVMRMTEEARRLVESDYEIGGLNKRLDNMFHNLDWN
ncbi:glycosyltransferase, partial [Acidobacteriota bacterium]